MNVMLSAESDEVLVVAKSVLRGSAIKQLGRLSIERDGDSIVMRGCVTSSWLRS